MRTRVRDVARRLGVRPVVVGARHRGLRPEDCFLASYPRSGNTWTRFVLADLATGSAPDFESIERIAPGIGSHAGAPDLTRGGRLIKTHEPYRPVYRRAIYLVRDARDVLVSWYRVSRHDPEDLSGLDAFVHDFLTPRATPYGSWTDHVNGWREAAAQQPDAIRTYRFEDLRADPEAGIAELASFLGLRPSSAEIQEALGRNTSSEMRRLEVESKEFLERSFGHRSQAIREGRPGTWQEILRPEHLEVLEPVMRVNRELGYADAPD